MGIVPPSNINDLQSVSASADVIRLTSGRDIRGAVVRYAESVFEIEQDDGSSLHQAADAIKDITFRPRAAVFEKPDEQDTTSGKITVYVNGSFVVNRSAEVSAIIPAKDISITTFGGSLKKLMTIRGGAPLATSIFAPGKVTMVFFFADWSEWCRGYSSQLEQFVKDDKEVVLRKFTGASHLDPVGKQFKLQRWPSALVYDRNGQFTGIVSGEDFGMFSNFVMQAKQVSGITVPPDSVVQHIKVAGLFHCDAPEVPKAQAQTLEKMKGTDEFLIGIEAGSPGQDLQGLSTFAAHARSGELCLVPASGPNVGIKLNGLVVCASNGTFHAFGAKVLPEDRHKLAFGVTYSLKPSATHTPYDWLVPPDAKRIVFSATSASPAPIDLPLHPSQVAGTDSPLPPGIVLPTNSYELQAISDSMDVIRLTTGREFKGAVVRYADTGFEIELDDGSTLKQARDTIQTIAFRPRAAIFENRNTPEAAGGQVVAYANGNFVVNTPEEARVNVSATSVAGASFGGSLKKIMTIHGGAALNTSIFAPGKVTMVFFYADWSEWCRSYKIKLEQLIKENNDVVLRIFDDAKPKDPAFIQFQRLRHWPSVCVYDRFGRFSGEVSGQDFSLFLGFVHKIQKATLPIASQDL